MPNLQGMNSVDRDEGGHSYAARTVDRRRLGAGDVLGMAKSSARKSSSGCGVKHESTAKSRQRRRGKVS